MLLTRQKGSDTQQEKSGQQLSRHKGSDAWQEKGGQAPVKANGMSRQKY